MFCQVVSQLSFKESPASAAFQVSLAPESVSLIQISFVINQLQRTSMGSGKTLFRVVLFNSRSQISRITDVEPRVGFRSEHVNVEHSCSSDHSWRVSAAFTRPSIAVHCRRAAPPLNAAFRTNGGRLCALPRESGLPANAPASLLARPLQAIRSPIAALACKGKAKRSVLDFESMATPFHLGRDG